jgi:hypothetical protein
MALCSSPFGVFFLLFDPLSFFLVLMMSVYEITGCKDLEAAEKNHFRSLVFFGYLVV